MKTKKVILQIMILLLLVGLASRVVGKNTVQVAINEPDFNLVDSSLTPVQQGVYEFTATVKNDGSDTAMSGSVPISWEKVTYDLPLTNGIGILDESIVDYDLNGDGDKADTFDVTWFHNATRPWDAIINDGTKDIHVYAINEGPPSDPGFNRTYYINGKPKLFHLGTESHSMTIATNDSASFGFGKVFINNHPSPNFELLLISSKVNAFDFKIDDNPVDLDFSATFTATEPYFLNTPTNGSVYVVPDIASEIVSGEETTFSCTLIAHDDITFDLVLIVNWSPDGTSRHRWVTVWEAISLEAINRPYFIPVDSDITSLETDKKQLTMTIKNIGGSATVGKVPVIWEELYYEFSLDNGEGTLDESITDLDINGDGDKEDTFEVKPIWTNRPLDATVDGDLVHSILDQPQSPWNNLTFFIDGKSKLFKLGSKSHALYMADNEIAAFGLGAVLR